MGILTSYPSWFLLLCIVSGFLYSSVLYLNNKRKTFSRTYKILLYSFRFITITLITFLLLEPLIRINKKHYNWPIIAVVQDNSSSIISGSDSAYIKENVLPNIEDWISANSEKAEIIHYTFGEEFSENNIINFTESSTDISQVFEEIKNRYYNKNLQGIILISDGIYNVGINPLNALNKVHVPVYTVALGDTSKKIDLAISSLIGNREVLINNYFPIELSINAIQAIDKQSKIIVKHNDAIIYNQKIHINSNQYSKLINIKALALKKGLNKITVSLDKIEGESNIQNNYRSFYFNVVEDKKKIVIFAHAPHPDVRALRSAFKSNRNFEVSVYTNQYPLDALSEADLLIMHQLPSFNNRAREINEYVKNSGLPVWYILGQQSSIPSINSLNTGIRIQSKGRQFTEAQGLINENFLLFTVPRAEIDMLQSMPPLNVPFGNYSISTGCNILAYQKIGSVVTSQALLFFAETQNQQHAVLLGEGLWRWRIHEFIRSASHVLFDSFISRVAQFLAQNNNRSRFRLMYKSIHAENEPVQFFAELYNANYELINDPEINLSMSGPQGKTYKYTFRTSGAAYTLNCGRLPPGVYKFTAQINSTEYPYSESGEFNVDEYNPELLNLRADHNILKLIANQSGGIMVYPDALNDITKELEKRNAFQKTYYTKQQFQDLLEWKYLFFIILLFLSAEWIIRKREGYY